MKRSGEGCYSCPDTVVTGISLVSLAEAENRAWSSLDRFLDSRTPCVPTSCLKVSCTDVETCDGICELANDFLRGVTGIVGDRKPSGRSPTSTADDGTRG